MLLERPDFKELVPILADNFKVKAINSHFCVNSSFGKGYCWAEKLPCGITVMVADTCLADVHIVERTEVDEQSFILQFNEEAENETEAGGKLRKRNNHEFQSFVKLSHTLVPEVYSFPAIKRLRTLKFVFNKDHLAHCLSPEALNEVLSQYFPLVINNENYEPIATEYRVMLDELWQEKIDAPLRLNYIQNRVLLLLEKYLLKLHERKDLHNNKSRRNEDETLRLMKVEALLVKNFSIPPPTIDELSRVSAMSPTKLKNDFKALYGLPIYEYYQKNRMNKAKSLLALDKYTIKEVGQMVGYSNLSHFANTFKKEFGFLPSELASRDGVLVYNR